MARLELENIPDLVLRQLEQRAARRGRSITDEAVECIATALAAEPAKERPLLSEIQKLRASLGDSVFLTDEDIFAARNEGRE